MLQPNTQPLQVLNRLLWRHITHPHTEGASDDDITSRTFKDQCSLSTYGVEEKIDLTPEEEDPKKKTYIKKVTPLEDWITEQLAQG